jgi:8-oxo-dGTP pyrophosphatase MutT (NUDIX family)
VLLGKRAENDSSPNLYEAFGGKCDLGETVLEALIREFWEETGLEILVIHGEVPQVDVFCTPKSRRWIAQVHFLLSAKPTSESFCSKRFGIELDPEEHQNFIWANGTLSELGSLTLTEGSRSHFGSAVAVFQRKVPCPVRQKPWSLLEKMFERWGMT